MLVPKGNLAFLTSTTRIRSYKGATQTCYLLLTILPRKSHHVFIGMNLSVLAFNILPGEI